MDPENLTDERKKEMAGQCTFFTVFIFNTIAFVCGLLSTGFCNFVARDIALTESIESVCQQVNLTSSNCIASLDNNAVGFYSWQATDPNDPDQVVCLSYTQEVYDVGYVTPDYDSKFQAVKAFGAIANIFGAFAFFTLCMSSCCPLSQERLKGLSCVFFIAFLFQALTMLIFRSDICSKDFFAAYFVNAPNLLDLVESVSCSLDRGAKLAISSTVLYFFCMNLVPVAVAPEPVEMSCGRGRQQPEEPDASPAIEDPADVTPAAE